MNSIINEFDTNFTGIFPFPYKIIDNFLNEELAEEISSEYPAYDDDFWLAYNNPIEIKKSSIDWRKFPPSIYKALAYLSSDEFSKLLEPFCDQKIYNDPGLWSGGMHIHANGGKLNPHLDFDVHSKLGLLRKYNLVIYLSKNWEPQYGGHFGMYSPGDETQPGKLEKEVEIKFNRAVIFDTTGEAWHGLSREVNCPEDNARKSLATFYYVETDQKILRPRARFAPTEDQKNNADIIDLIRERSK